ncbi:hypothetical protein HN018_19285 [Lichenicola cladoniae]|uniref:SMODS and SLOG-associating 2TM effector domain-containing protein n=1 Tax=Lichenicola cladoniae TaxID=1484109 RepID=A0A6M8HTP2_9PROT|nr:hypothetical protein [Lichenicola cladoniae]NPD68290.1 hypothetical protein [Acetobacteraceae bacterium]QKE91889.1 hypothetical protein HN018_19285 [Lichenicola cladoniae]
MSNNVPSMTPNDVTLILEHYPPPVRQQSLYWNQLVQLKVGAEYIKAYRERVAGRIWLFDLIKAVASSGAIAAWAIVQAHPLVWGGVIAIAQVADVIKGTLPLAKVHEGAARLTQSLDALFIEAQFEWERIAAGKLEEEEISAARRRIMTVEHDLQAKHFPYGLTRRSDLLKVAETETAAYFKGLFDMEVLR